MLTASILKRMGKIDPKKEYYLNEILSMGVLPYRDIRTLARVVQADIDGANLLRTVIEGEGRGRRYSIKGANLTKFLERYGSGIALTASKRKS